MNAPDKRGDPLGEFERAHRRLAELLLRHRIALVERDGTRAAACFGTWRTALARHIQLEETFLLPWLDKSARWAPRVYLAEHRKVERLADALAGPVGAISGKSVDPERILDLLEREMPLQHLAAHHHEREEMDLLPVCRRRMSSAAVRRLSAALVAADGDRLGPGAQPVEAVNPIAGKGADRP